MAETNCTCCYIKVAYTKSQSTGQPDQISIFFIKFHQKGECWSGQTVLNNNRIFFYSLIISLITRHTQNILSNGTMHVGLSQRNYGVETCWFQWFHPALRSNKSLLRPLPHSSAVLSTVLRPQTHVLLHTFWVPEETGYANALHERRLLC